MNKCMASDIQEMLPELLHNALPATERGRVEQHVVACESCREELRVLRAVKEAAVFAPAIDAARIARQIPPYRGVLPASAPARSRMTQWLVAATAAVLIIGGGSVVMNRDSATTEKIAVVAPATGTGASELSPVIASPGTAVAAAPQSARAAADQAIRNHSTVFVNPSARPTRGTWPSAASRELSAIHDRETPGAIADV